MRSISWTNAKIFLFAVLMIPTGRNANAQQKATVPQGPMAPPQSFFGKPGPKSPEFGPHGTIIFRLMAPGANAVKLAGDWQRQNEDPLAMTKGEDGLWELSLSGLKSELRTYTFLVDG